MSDLHHEFERAAALAAATAPCWFCGAAAPARSDGLPPQCADVAACFARSVSPPGCPSILDPVARAAEKQASRDDDAARLAAGDVTREELAAENSAFTGVATRIAWERAGRLA